MEDLVINRALPTTGCKRMQHCQDGPIYILLKGEVVVLAPTKSASGKKLSSHFTIQKLSGSLSSRNENWLHNALAWDDQAVALGQARLHTAANGLKALQLSVSDSGVSKDKSSLVLVVTDTMNGHLMQYHDGSLESLALVNELIGSFESINIGNVVLSEDLDKLRIKGMLWLKGIGNRGAVWPHQGHFVVFTSSSNTYVFTVNEEAEIVYGFDLGYTQNEHGVDFDISEGLESSYCYITVVTNFNRVIVKKLSFSDDGLFTCESENKKIEAVDESIVATLSIKSMGEIFLAIFYTNTITINQLSSDNKGLIINVNTNIIIESMDYFEGLDGLVHVIFTNSFGYLGHIKFNSKSFTYDMNEYNYFNGITSNTLPFFKKLNELNSNGKEKYVIDTLAMDPTRTFLEFTYYPVNFTTKIDFLGNKRDPLMFSVVKTLEEAEVNFRNREIFNSIQSSPSFVKSVAQLEHELSSNASLAEADEREKVKIKLEQVEEGGAEDDENASLSLNNTQTAISAAMFQNDKLEQLRIETSMKGSTLVADQRVRILALLAKQVVSMVERGDLQLTSEYDTLMFLQYCSFLGLNKTPESTQKLPVLGCDLPLETFCGAKCTREGALPQLAVSEEGHSWSICMTTLLPLLSSSVKRCSNCGSRRVAAEDVSGSVVEAVLAQTAICVFCGGKYV